MSVRSVASMTAFENQIVDELVLFDMKYAPRRELLCCLTSDGASEIDRAVGTINRVDLPKSLDAVLKAGDGVRLFHNHPSEGSLSAADWWQSIRWNGKADLIAINRHRTIFSGAAKNVPELTALLSRVELDEVRDCGECALFAAACPPDAHQLKPIATHLVSHLLNIELCSLGLVYYEFQLSVRDDIIWSACRNCQIWDSVSAEMRGLL